MADGLVKGDRTALDGQIPVLVGDGQGSPQSGQAGCSGRDWACWSSKVVRVLRQAGGSGLGYLLQGGEVGSRRASVAGRRGRATILPHAPPITDLLDLCAREDAAP